jgi:hypothetical protein
VTKRFVGTFAMVAIVIAVAVTAIWFRPDASSMHSGRKLRHWICPNSVDRWGPDTMNAYQSNSVAAFASAGERGLELLLDELGCKQSPSDSWRFAKAREWQRRSPFLANLLYFRWNSGSPDERVQGASALLDRQAFDDRHVPLLARHLAAALRDSPTLSTFEFGAMVRLGGITRALVRSGTNGVRIIADAVANPHSPDQVALMVGLLKTDNKYAGAAVPALIALASLGVDQAYGKKTGNLRLLFPLHPSSERSHLPLALDALSVIRGPASLPFLVQVATNAHTVAISAVGEYGRAAQAYLPQLLPLTTNADPQVSFQAEIAVRKIRGEVGGNRAVGGALTE